MMSAPLLQAHEVKRTYRTAHAKIDLFAGLSFEIQTGEKVAVMGASGSGKSTLLHMLGGLDTPDSGSVFFKGTSLYDSSHRWRCRYRHQQIGFVFQGYHLLSELTILENVALPAQVTEGSSRSLKQAKELLAAVGLEDRLQHRPQELSGGEQQRAAVARALINHPAIILADEPTGNLDQDTGDKVLHYLFQLIEGRGHSLVMVTHSPSVADRCDKQWMLDQRVLKEVS
jgi:lipoprotein-releasing system ATP-binding protein